MAKKIDFIAKRKRLHNEILMEIVKMMKDNNYRLMKFPKKGKFRPRILRWLDLVDVYELVEVKLLSLHGDGLRYKATRSSFDVRCEKDWWPLNRRVAHCHITELYDAVFEHFQCNKYAA